MSDTIQISGKSASKRDRYFAVTSGLILALSVWGFSDNLIWDISQPSNTDPKFVIHGLFCLAWMTLFFVQANLVRIGNVGMHRRLGVAGFLIASGVVASTLFVFWSVWRGWDAMPYYVKANRLLFIGFITCIALAFANRRRPDWHKRFVLVGTLYLLEPILSRAFDPIEFLFEGKAASEIDFYWLIFFVITWNLLFISLLAHDWRSIRRIHQVSTWGYICFLAVWPVVLTT